MRLIGLTVVTLFVAASAAGATSCFMDQYGNEYWFDINFAEGYVYGTTESAQGCDAPTWYLQGSFYITTSGIQFELSASNPLGDADNYCIASYKLKGIKVGANWEFMWYYQWRDYGDQPGNLVPCSMGIPVPVEGRGMLRE
ncbi:MAG: hypothetical protein ACE5OP_14125 [Candidatus Glassbacteria bacterium]